MKKDKKIIKIILIVLLLLTVGLIISNNAFASWNMDLESYDRDNAERAGNKITNIMGAIINMMSTVGAGIAIIMLIVIGIQYVSKGAEGKAEAKKDLTGYIIGAVILFGVSGILKILQMFINANLNND